MISFAAGSHWREIMSLAFAGAIVWTGWLLAAVIGSQYKWAYYVFAIVMGIFYIYYALLWTVRYDAEKMGGQYQFTQLSSSAFICFMLVMYAVCWACCEGANTVSNSSEMVWYGILDLFSKPFFLIYFLWMTRDVDYTLLRETRYTHEHAQYQAEADAANNTAQAGAITQTGAGPRSRFAPVVGPRSRLPFGNRNKEGRSAAARTVDEDVGHATAPAAVATAAAVAPGDTAASTDPEKAAAGKRYRKLFSRRGAHDDKSVPPVAPGTGAGTGVDGEHGTNQPVRTSNVTMVESDQTHEPHEHQHTHPFMANAPAPIIVPTDGTGTLPTIPTGPIVPPPPAPAATGLAGAADPVVPLGPTLPEGAAPAGSANAAGTTGTTGPLGSAGAATFPATGVTGTGAPGGTPLSPPSRPIARPDHSYPTAH